MMASGFQFQGQDLDVICEPKRVGVDAAKFGGAAGRYRKGSEDLYDRYASYPSGYGYAQYPMSGSVVLPNNVFKGDGANITPPSAGGRRPFDYSARIAMRTAGTWYIWRDVSSNSIKVRNPSGTVTSYANSLFGTNIPPIIMVCRAVGGGGGGGGGGGTQPAGGGGGGGGCAVWIDIPNATEANYSTTALQCVVGGGGARGGAKANGVNGVATTISRAGTTLVTANGGAKGVYNVSGGAGGSCSVVSNSFCGSFFTKSGASGGGRDSSGSGLSMTAFAISPEKTIAAWSQSGGADQGRGGGGGASPFGNGGLGGGNGSSPTSGSGYGSGGGGGTWILFSSQAGAAGLAGQVVFDY